MRAAELRVDGNLEIDARGLPKCAHRAVAAPTVRGIRGCRSALVGSGTAGVLTGANGSEASSNVSVGLFNGGTRNGVTILFARALGPEVGPQPLLARISIADERSGRYGSLLRIQVPRMADGLGSLTSLHVKLRRTFAREGRRASLVTARCADGELRFLAPKMLFRNEASVPGVAPSTTIKGSSAAPCTARS